MTMTQGLVSATQQQFIEKRKFNRFLDITDPAEFLGFGLSNFDISISYPVPTEIRERLGSIQQEFYTEISRKIQEEKLGNTKCKVLDYQDSKVVYENPRRYLKIEYSTARKTQVTSLVRCLISGDNLYIGLDSYVLGGLKISSLVIQSVISFLALFLSLRLLPLFPLVAIYLFFNWIDVYRATRQKPGLLYGLRCKFNKSLDLGSFNVDDTLMFLKSASPIVTSTIEEVFKRNGIPSTKITELLKGIDAKVSGQSVSLNAGGNISLFGVNIASYGSNASNS